MKQSQFRNKLIELLKELDKKHGGERRFASEALAITKLCAKIGMKPPGRKPWAANYCIVLQPDNSWEKE